MKHLHFLVFPLLLVASSAHAQLSKTPIQMGQEKIKTKVPIVSGTVLGGRTRVGERYRLWLSFNPTDVNDPMYPGKSNPYDDHAFECYGQLKLNGNTVWQRTKEAANGNIAKVGHYNLPAPLEVNPRTQGYRLNRNPLNSGEAPRIFEFESLDGQPSASTVHLSLKLYDRDNPLFYDDGPYNTPPDRNDDVFADYKLDLNLLKMGEGHYYWYWQGTDESGNAVGSNLFLYIEHVGSVYATKKPPVGEIHVIEKSKLPGKLPSPGPVINKSRRIGR